MGFIQAGDEVILLEPVFELYECMHILSTKLLTHILDMFIKLSLLEVLLAMYLCARPQKA